MVAQFDRSPEPLLNHNWHQFGIEAFDLEPQEMERPDDDDTAP